MYIHGDGVFSDHKTATKCNTKAAEQRYASSKTNLGVNQVTGFGVLTDHLRAYMWWHLASYNGDKGAGENKDRLTQATDVASCRLEIAYTDC